MANDPTETSPYSGEVRQYTTDVPGHLLDKSGGTVHGGFTTKVFELWAKVDFVNKAKIA